MNKMPSINSNVEEWQWVDHSLHLAVLSEGVAHAAHLEVLFGHLHLAAHGARLAGVLAIGVRVAGLEEHLILLAFSAQRSITIFRALLSSSIMCHD